MPRDVFHFPKLSVPALDVFDENLAILDVNS